MVGPSRSTIASLTLFGPNVSNPRRRSVREDGDGAGPEETSSTSYLQAWWSLRYSSQHLVIYAETGFPDNYLKQSPHSGIALSHRLF